MAQRNVYRTVRVGEGWAVHGTHPNHAPVFQSQEEAWNEARRLARGAGGEAELHTTDGRVQTRNTYRREVVPSKGR